MAAREGIESPARALGVWRIDRFSLDERTRTLGSPRAQEVLDRSAFLVLQYLALHAGEVCTQNELLHAGWPGRIVTANSLAKCVGRLRRALEDEDGLLLRVVHGYGYRLAGAVGFRPVPVIPVDTSRAPGIPGVGEAVPHRPGWRVAKVLGSSPKGIVLLAHTEGEERGCAFKFALDQVGLRGLKREVGLFQLMQERHCGETVADPLLDWNLERPPFFVVTRHHPLGNLAQWAASAGGLAQMDLDRRLQLAIAVCEGVAPLHDLDIAHRDLKPENLYPESNPDGSLHIVVGDLGAGFGGLPPGVDALGLAIGSDTLQGLLDDDPGGPATRYLAPEVMAGRAATIRSDVYTLGVLVYQILVGDFLRPLAPGWREQIDDELLRDDIAGAAHIDPERRLASARSLVRRLNALEQRHSERQRSEAAERERVAQAAHLARTQRRWRVWTAISAMLTLGLGFSLWMGHRAEQAGLRERQSADEARAVLQFLTDDLLLQADPYRLGERSTGLREAMEKAALRVSERFANQPTARAAVHRALAEVRDGWGDFHGATEHLLAARSALAADPRSDRAERADVERGLCQHHRMLGDLDRAAEACAAAEARDLAVFGEVTAATRTKRAKLDYERGRCDRAAADLDRVIGEGALAAGSEEWIEAHWYSGLCHAWMARFAASENRFESLLGFQIQRLGEDHPQVARIRIDYADTLVDRGQLGAAQGLATKARSILVGQVGPDDPAVAITDYVLGRVEQYAGNAAAAVPHYRSALTGHVQAFGEGHPWTIFVMAEYAWALAEAGESTEAERWWRQSRALGKAAMADNPQRRAYLDDTWTRGALALGWLDAAEGELADLTEAVDRGLPAHHPLRSSIACLHVELELRRARGARALEWVEDCRSGYAQWPHEDRRRREALEWHRQAAILGADRPDRTR